MEKITMSKKSTLTINEAFELFIRKCKIKNLTDLSISSYEKKMVHFYEFTDKNECPTSNYSSHLPQPCGILFSEHPFPRLP